MEIKAKAVAARIGGWFVHSDGNTARDLDSQKKCGLAVARVTGVQVNAVSGNSFATFEPGIRDVYTLANKRFRGGVEDLVIGYNDALRLT